MGVHSATILTNETTPVGLIVEGPGDPGDGTFRNTVGSAGDPLPVIIQNTEPVGDRTVFLGDPQVTAQTGFPLVAGASLPISFLGTDASEMCGLAASSTPAAAASVTAGSAPTSPLTVVAATNDTFVFTGDGGAGSPETFTVAEGTYTGAPAIAAAMAAAVGGSAEAFSTLANVTVVGGKIKLTAPAAGTAYNGDTVTTGSTDVLASLGFTSPATFAGGAAADGPIVAVLAGRQ